MAASKVIAWIEDDVDLVAPVVKPLEKAGFQIVKYYTYGEALKQLEVIRRCDLILLDLYLPPGGVAEDEEYLGKKLLERLRNEFKVNVPVIVFSGWANASDVLSSEEATQLNAITVAKPVRPSYLKSEVFQLLRLPEG